MRSQKLRITGMTCARCAQTVESVLNTLGAQAKVSYKDGLAQVEVPKDISADRLIRAIEAAGYGASLLGKDLSEAGSSDPGHSLHVAIIGSGSAAFACAIRAADEGARVTMIETGILGGTCVNTGCVPSKILIRGAQLAHWQKDHPFAGMEKRTPILDRSALVAQQQARVEALRQSKYQSILDDTPSITLMRGFARFEDAQTLVVRREAEETRLRADRILIATGSTPMVPPVPGLEETPFWTSADALVAEEIPEHLIVLGGSAVGLEIGQAFLHLGAKLTVIELFSLLPKLDAGLGRGLRKVLEAEGARVLTHSKIKGTRFDGARFVVDAGSDTMTGDRLLVATGRRPNTAGLDLAKAGIESERNGAVGIDERMRTSVAHIYAAGDCTDQPQFVYVAAAAGTRAAINMLGGEAILRERARGHILNLAQVGTIIKLLGYDAIASF